MMFFDDGINDPEKKAAYPTDLQSCVTIAVALCVKVGKELVAKYAPQRQNEFSDKYVYGIRDKYIALMNAGRIINVNLRD